MRPILQKKIEAKYAARMSGQLGCPELSDGTDALQVRPKHQ